MECRLIWTTGKIVTKHGSDLSEPDPNKGCRDEDQFSAYELTIPITEGVLWETILHGVLFCEMGATTDCGSMASGAGKTFFLREIREGEWNPWHKNLEAYAQAVHAERDQQQYRWEGDAFERVCKKVEDDFLQRGHDAVRKEYLQKERAKIDAELTSLEIVSTPEKPTEPLKFSKVIETQEDDGA